jgi:hypothetical protein
MANIRGEREEERSEASPKIGRSAETAIIASLACFGRFALPPYALCLTAQRLAVTKFANLLY